MVGLTVEELFLKGSALAAVNSLQGKSSCEQPSLQSCLPLFGAYQSAPWSQKGFHCITWGDVLAFHRRPLWRRNTCVVSGLDIDQIMWKYPRYLGIPGLFRNTFGAWMFLLIQYEGVGECFQELVSNLPAPRWLVGCSNLQVSWPVFTACLL